MIRFSFNANDPNKPHLREKSSIYPAALPELEKGSRQMFNIFIQISVFVLAHTNVCFDYLLLLWARHDVFTTNHLHQQISNFSQANLDTFPTRLRMPFFVELWSLSVGCSNKSLIGLIKMSESLEDVYEEIKTVTWNHP